MPLRRYEDDPVEFGLVYVHFAVPAPFRRPRYLPENGIGAKRRRAERSGARRPLQSRPTLISPDAPIKPGDVAVEPLSRQRILASLIDIQAAPQEDLEQALATPDVARLVLAPASPVRPSRPLLWPTESPAINQAHDVPAHPPDVALYVLRNAEVAGAGASPMRGASYLYAPDIMPGYLKEFIVNDVEATQWARAVDSAEIRIRTGFSLVHYNMVYGHWLLEMLPKLFVIRRMVDAGVPGAIVLPLGTPAFVLNHLQLIVPEVPIQWFDPKTEHVAADLLICPSMYNVHYHYNTALNAEFDMLIGRFARPQPDHRPRPPSVFHRLAQWLAPRRVAAADPAPERIFISRAGLAPSYRCMSNQAEIEAVARRRGFTIVQPERLSLPEQLRTFQAADIIVGEFGSGMHNALFARPDARIFCLNWISDVQSRIANLRGQRVGYQLPDDGRPRTFSFEPKIDSFRMDPGLFDHRLRDLCEGAGAAP